MSLLTSHCSFNIDDLVVHFPYDKIYPEQYQYMCDLKKALDAQVRVPSHSNGCGVAMSIILKWGFIGTLCTGNAFGYGQDGLFAIAYCCISNGEHLHYSATATLFAPRSTQCGYVVPLATSRRQSQTRLLFTNGARDRESACRASAIDGVSSFRRIG